jgi:hypothetical protein
MERQCGGDCDRMMTKDSKPRYFALPGWEIAPGLAVRSMMQELLQSLGVGALLLLLVIWCVVGYVAQ